MAQPPTTIYANLVNFRLTPMEFVLEFGAHFPDRPGQPPASDFRPDVRVVIPAPAFPGLVQALQKLMAARPTQQPPKPSPGFQGPDVTKGKS
jgi:Protein of unknown function (DUF3467)